MGFSIKIEKQSSKFVKPFVPTPSTLFHYKLGFIDELVPAAIDVGVVLFFSINSNNHNPNLFVQLERSLGKTLTQFYPLAGRYVDNTPSIDCTDCGAEFIRAKVNIKLEDFLVSEGNAKFIDEFIPSKIGSTLQQSDPLLAAQVTTFECGSVAIGVSATHKIVDASTLSTLINEWAVTNRKGNEIESTGPHFNSSLLFPARGLSSSPMQHMDSDILSKYTRKKLSFSESVISSMKAKRNKLSPRRWSKVQIASAIIWKTFVDADFAIHNFQRESILIQPVNLRGKMASLISKTSCGNLWGSCLTQCKTLDTTEELVDRLSDSVKKSVTNFSLGNHNQEEGQAMVLNSLLNTKNIRESTNAVFLTSWCKFPFYEADFGFGKPIWAAPGMIPINHSVYLMDDAEGNGVEAYVFLELKYVPFFEEALQQVNAFAT
ncbi:hypothetical protein SSX86_018259 [Deinandra increscens subsp. villosa]|uniref:Transferase, Chloramphenicol acetyltransferase-like domain protein n=1 Tax=Deinandra increscens subsp. villosa TaxID=3103831 RepID=A0AAP0GUL5_9ASTR